MQITTQRIRWTAAGTTGLIGSALWANAATFGDHVPAAALLAAGAGTALGWRRVYGFRSGSDRRPGMATWGQVWRTSSVAAMRRKARVVRPSLAGLSRRDLRRVDPLTYATPLCRIGRQQVWTSVEESTLSVGIPGTGKTAALACRILDAPGAVLTTSTAPDLYRQTHQIRAQRGPVYVFNADGIGGIPSTLRWSPLVGCAAPETAHRRAADLMGPPGDGEAARWHGHGAALLAVLLHAAALSGGARMRDIQAWIGEPDRALPLVEQLLAASPERAAMTQTARSLLGMNPRTRDGILLAVTPALAWLTSPASAACGDPITQEDLFDLEEFFDSAGTLYLFGDNNRTLGPLFGALTSEIVHRARAIASMRPGERLDPAFRMVLDEIALTCPVPLDEWKSELRKRSIGIDSACQGLGQMRERWGANRAGMILNSSRAVLVYGGAKDPDDLAAFCKLAGDHKVRTPTCDAAGRITSWSETTEPVITAAELCQLPDFRALLIRRGMPVALARTPKVWDRRDVKRVNRTSRVPHRVTSPAPHAGPHEHLSRDLTDDSASTSAETSPNTSQPRQRHITERVTADLSRDVSHASTSTR